MGTWLLALATFAAGLRGAWVRYRSSQVVAVPSWSEHGQAEPADPLQSQMGWLAALIYPESPGTRTNCLPKREIGILLTE